MVTFTQINLDSKLAYYLQVKEALLAKIESSELIPGDKLPSEAVLCEQMGVSRTVVRQALMELEHDGWLRKRKGKGSFITDDSLRVTLSHGQENTHNTPHRRLSIKVFNQEMLPASAQIASNLDGVEESDLVIRVESIRYLEDVPMVISDTYLPLWVCPDLTDAVECQRALYSLGSHNGVEVNHSSYYIKATAADEKVAEALSVPLGSPMLKKEAKIFTADDRQIEYYIDFHHGEFTALNADIAEFKVMQDDHKQIQVLGSGTFRFIKQ